MFHYYSWSPCFLFIIFFIIGSTAMVTPSLPINEDGYASTQEEHSNAKVTATVTIVSTNKQTKSEQETSSRMSINNTQEVWSRQGSVEKEDKTPNKPSLIGRNKAFNKKHCDYVPKDSSKSTLSMEKEASKYEGFHKMARKLLPRHQDMDAFVAYADYRGPRRHPPRNN